MTLDSVVQEVLRRAENFGVESSPWSIGEVLGDDIMYQELQDWARSSPMPLDKLLIERLPNVIFQDRPVTRSQGYGLALLALATEHGRRHAQARMIWGCFAQLAFLPDARARLLTPGGQPTFGFQHVMADAVRRLNLRNILDEDDKNRWATTVFLQFGVPKGSIANLASWLDNSAAASDAVLDLLDPSTGNQAFQRAWGALKNARRSTRDQLADELKKSSWFGWNQDVVVDACDAAMATRFYPIARSEPIQEDAEDAIVGQPRFRWTGDWSTPQFEVDLLPLSGSESHPGILDLWINGTREIRLIKARSGEYRPADNKPKRDLRALESIVVLRDSRGVEFSQEQSVWVLDQDRDLVAAYDLESGERQLGSLNSSRSYVLVLGSRARIGAANLPTVAFGEGTIAYLNTPWEPVSVHSSEGELWETTALTRRGKPDTKPALEREPGLEILGQHAWVRHDGTQSLDIRDLDSTKVRIHLPHGWTDGTVLDGEHTAHASIGRSTRLRNLTGYGEALSVVKGKSAATPEAEIRTLIESVVDAGIVDGFDGTTLKLTCDIGWSDRHGVVAWLRSGPVISPKVHVAVENGITEINLEVIPQDKIRAIAVRYEDGRLGAWWASDWSEGIERNQDSAMRALIAARWMKLPIAAEPHRTRLRELAEEWLPVAYEAWVRSPPPSELDGVPVQMNGSRGAERWPSIARSVLYDRPIQKVHTEIHRVLQLGDPSKFPGDYKALHGAGAANRLPRFMLLEVGPEPLYWWEGPGARSVMTQTYLLNGSEIPLHKGTKKRLIQLLGQSVSKRFHFDSSTDTLGQLVKLTTAWFPCRFALADQEFRTYAAVCRLGESP